MLVPAGMDEIHIAAHSPATQSFPILLCIDSHRPVELNSQMAAKREQTMRASIPIARIRHSRIGVVLDTLAREVVAFADALTSPNRIIDKVEEMGALHREANTIESADPERAAQLRARASLILLR